MAKCAGDVRGSRCRAGSHNHMIQLSQRPIRLYLPDSPIEIRFDLTPFWLYNALYE